MNSRTEKFLYLTPFYHVLFGALGLAFGTFFLVMLLIAFTNFDKSFFLSFSCLLASVLLVMIFSSLSDRLAKKKITVQLIELVGLKLKFQKSVKNETFFNFKDTEYFKEFLNFKNELSQFFIESFKEQENIEYCSTVVNYLIDNKCLNETKSEIISLLRKNGALKLANLLSVENNAKNFGY